MNISDETNSAAPLQAPARPNRESRYLFLGTLAVVVLAALLGLRIALNRELRVETDPPGATLFINGRLAGKTPLTLTDLPSGAYSLRLEKEHFTPLSLPVTLGMGVTRLNETLPARGEGALKISVEPSGSEVLLDNEIVGHTPLQLDNVAAGPHELLIRKTNFKPFTQRVDVAVGKTLEYRDFALEDIILTMLQNAIEKDSQRVAHYMDMGHYLFVNNKIRESAEFYVRGLKVASEPLTFAPEMSAEERGLEQSMRSADSKQLIEDVNKKMHSAGRNLPAKDMALFQKLVSEQQEAIASKNVGDWQWVQTQAENFSREKKYELAEKLYLNHIEAAKGMDSVAQAYIGLITLRLHVPKAAEALQAGNEFADTRFANSPPLARQAANAIYTNAGPFQAKEKTALLALAEVLLHRALANSPKHGEMSGLCKFELGNVLVLQERLEEALPLYRDSVAETSEPMTKALRSQREVDALRRLNKLDEARQILTLLAVNPHADIAQKAKADLHEMDASAPH